MQVSTIICIWLPLIFLDTPFFIFHSRNARVGRVGARKTFPGSLILYVFLGPFYLHRQPSSTSLHPQPPLCAPPCAPVLHKQSILSADISSVTLAVYSFLLRLNSDYCRENNNSGDWPHVVLVPFVEDSFLVKVNVTPAHWIEPTQPIPWHVGGPDIRALIA